MALMSLALRTCEGHPKSGWWVMMLGIFGAALFYGDGVITPATWMFKNASDATAYF